MLPARRLALLPALLSVCALLLTACGGSDDSGDEPFPGAGRTSDRLDAVTISGEVGSPPKVTWKTGMDAGKIETKTVTEGDGDVLKGQDDVLTQIWIGNGYSKQKVFSTYDDKRAELLTVDNQLPEFLAGIRDARIGSRLAVTASAEEAFGPAGNAQLGIGNKDTVLVIIDLMSKVMDKPSGDRSPYPDWMPVPQFTKGVITGFSFDGVQPSAQLRHVELLKGTGPRIEKGQTIAVRYLGQAFGGDKPFDQNFGDTGDGKPTTFGIGTGQVIKGWDKALVGVPVGSRVVLEVPPELGYGAEGSPDSGIPANATLVFMIDILGAA